MTRISKHYLQYQNTTKNQWLLRLFSDCKLELEEYIDQIVKQKIKLKNRYSSKELTGKTINHSNWKQCISKTAVDIVKSNLKYTKNKTFKRYKKIYSYFAERNRQIKFLSKRYSELKINYLKRIRINIKNITLTLNDNLFNTKKSNKEFNEFIQIRLPYFQTKRKSIQVNIPIKHYSYMKKYLKNWKRKNTIQLQFKNNKFFLNLIFEKEIEKKTSGDNIGVDIGYKKLISTSNNKFYGKNLEKIYEKLSKKKRDSKNYKQLLQYKKNEINRETNTFFNENNIQTLFIEDLKNLKYKSKLSTKFLNKLQYWSYSQIINKFEQNCQEKGINLVKVSPSYTSQTCSKCGSVHSNSRHNELFKCIDCGFSADADYNAAVNILHRGENKYGLSTTEINP